MEEKTTEKHESMKKDHQQTVCLSTVWEKGLIYNPFFVYKKGAK